MQSLHLTVETVVRTFPEDLNSREENKQLTLLLSCFSESFSHFMKSGDGATGVSSTLGGVEGPFAGGAGERAVAAETVPLDEATDPMDEDGVIVGRPAGDAATTAADAFPLAPTVVHAPPTNEAAEFAYIRNAFDQSK